METELFVDKIKQAWLMDSSQSDEITAMISYSDTNKSLTSQLAILTTLMRLGTMHMKGKYKNLLWPQAELIEKQMLGVNNQGREDAIRMRAELARYEKETNEGGLHGLLNK